MAFSGGYESDLNLNNVKLLGDFPIEHSLGGYGIAIRQQTNTVLRLIHLLLDTGLVYHFISFFHRTLEIDYKTY